MKIPQNIENLVNNRFFQHMMFWTFFLFLETLHLSNIENDSDVFKMIIISVNKFISAISVVYLNLFVLIPYLLEKNKTYFYIILITFSFIAVIYFVYLFHTYIIEPHFELTENSDFRLRNPIFGFMGMTFLMTILSSLIHFTKRWVKLKDIEIDLKEEQRQRLEAELKTLKAQVNPHFLFNSLNNIYSLSLDKSDLAPEMILKLSDLMSYMIYDARAEAVPLKNELDFVKNHIDLEKIRVKNRVNVEVDINNDLSSFEIAPLLFTPFVENAFKYVSNSINEKSNIIIRFAQKENELEFYVENSAEAEKLKFNHEKHGIGIENVKKRLDLIYSKKYSLDIKHTQEKFKVSLKIDLS